MTKARKILAVLMCLITLLGVSSIAAGCPPQNNAPEKYDVSIKIVCKSQENGVSHELGTYLFTTNVSERHIERDYTGLEYYYSVYQYNLPDHPRWNEAWLTPKAHDFEITYYQLPPENSHKCVCERGEYKIGFKATSNIPDGKPREVILYVTVV